MSDQPTEDVVERVARAIWELSTTRPRSFDLLHPIKQDDVRAQARAAIEALREPTEAMLDATSIFNQHRARETWQNMIDAALGKKP